MNLHAGSQWERESAEMKGASYQACCEILQLRSDLRYGVQCPVFVQSLFHLSGDLRLYTVRGIVLLIKVMLLFIFRIKSVIQILNAALLTQDNVLQRLWLGFTDFVHSLCTSNASLLHIGSLLGLYLCCPDEIILSHKRM